MPENVELEEMHTRDRLAEELLNGIPTELIAQAVRQSTTKMRLTTLIDLVASHPRPEGKRF